MKRRPLKLESVKEYLDKLEDGKLLTTTELTKRLNITPTYVRESRDRLREYVTEDYDIIYWGNPKTIQYVRENEILSRS